ncbi:hypothetical protein Zmor_008859 [Zophobas morio]|uniref:Serine-tRNA synthetase type1 N-terminal domain-containing protein n=1 Tax=Zophobas morio TaxID=2755281 RepID=A0AA38M016_9CUCU|nr:hypothetical protein Zmor_008859 [Zophobas morio]
MSVVELNKKRKEIILNVENLKAEKNKFSKEIGELMRNKETEKANELKDRVSKINVEIEKMDPELEKVQEELNSLASTIPNIPNDNMPVGLDEEENIEIRK